MQNGIKIENEIKLK